MAEGELMEDVFSKSDASTIMTVREVAHYLRLSQAKVYRLAQAGEIPATRIGKSWRFRKDMIDDWFCQSVRAGSDATVE
jgi:excisionase family DNA binding protein